MSMCENPFPHWRLHPGAFRWIDDPMFAGAKQAQQQVPIPEFLEAQDAGYSVSAATTCVLRALWGRTLLRGWRKPAAHGPNQVVEVRCLRVLPQQRYGALTLSQSCVSGTPVF